MQDTSDNVGEDPHDESDHLHFAPIWRHLRTGARVVFVGTIGSGDQLPNAEDVAAVKRPMRLMGFEACGVQGFPCSEGFMNLLAHGRYGEHPILGDFIRLGPNKPQPGDGDHPGDKDAFPGNGTISDPSAAPSPFTKGGGNNTV